MKIKGQKRKEKTNLERQHQTILEGVGTTFVVQENQSLEQPTPYRIVQTVTTYSAYEEPF